ncbi:lipid A biosynthesis acyltransferase [Flavobacterium cyanobacteriorum]|uniref:Lipid A biosynthesis acyltransferase n=2 Tax=Flavobacterium cyanobacteriorum TaxID=2022802 RepID=A0A255ZM64_9FLAO|nr:lipid A biosynthesis acyltransferase [Flavobacterium cyanobacteriorum]
MKFLAFAIAYPILLFLSVLPFRLLYIFSDMAYVLVYYVIGYRKSTVRLNLKLTLPNLTEGERKKIEKKFYRHFCDTFAEMVKLISISDREIKKRFVFENIELLHEYERKGKSIAVMIAHYGSYEWLLVMNRYFVNHKGYGIYKKINNRYFDDLVRKIRGKFDATLIDTKESVGVMKENKKKGILGCYGFISDQSPKIHRVPYWGKFFGMEVPVHGGAELLAKKLDMNVLYVKGGKIKRGHYKATFIGFEGNPQEVPNFEITDRFLRILEDTIREAPEYYLWTHKRFKHRRNDPPAITGTSL